jgi:hypothetical protein
LALTASSSRNGTVCVIFTDSSSANTEQARRCNAPNGQAHVNIQSHHIARSPCVVRERAAMHTRTRTRLRW